MSPADIVAEWPTSDDIVHAVFAACKREGEDPIAVLQGKPASRARLYALIALGWRFPAVNRSKLGARVGDAGAANKARNGVSRQLAGWFSLDLLNDVRAACGWGPMTMAEACAAPLLYCGRSWQDFLPRPSETCAAESPGAADGVNPVAGSGGEPEPATDTAPARAHATVTTSSPGKEGGKDPAPISDARAKASVGKTLSPSRNGARMGLRVGAAEGAQPSPGVAAASLGRHADGFAARGPDPGEAADLAQVKRALASKFARVAEAGLDIEDGDLPCAPPQPSPRAAALAEAARAMRPIGARARVIDRRPLGGDVTAILCGDPPPGRSALDQRGGR